VKVAITGATGTIGRAVVSALLARGDTVTVLSRDAGRARSCFGDDVQAVEWRDPKSEPAPLGGLEGRDAVVHLLGEPVAQRWSDDAKREIRESRVLGTRNLVAGLGDLPERPRVLISQSGAGWYGHRGDERLDESAPPGDDFLAQLSMAWEAEAERAEELGVRVVRTRTGMVLSPSGGALERMLPFFKLGIGGPVAGGRQYVPWIHLDDVVGALLACLDDESASGPVNLTAPEPATNRELAKALGRVLRRPAFAPVPALAVRLLYGDMASVVTTGQRAVPARLEALGYRFKRPELEEALRAALSA
jgi:uncharacterized protein (TIGR01777 family)